MLPSDDSHQMDGNSVAVNREKVKPAFNVLKSSFRGPTEIKVFALRYNFWVSYFLCNFIGKFHKGR